MQQEVKVGFNPEPTRAGYANELLIQHSQYEFIMDFLSICLPAGTAVSRVFTSPAHFKRMVNALNINLRMYEEQFGKISEASEKEKSNIGFKMS